MLIKDAESLIKDSSDLLRAFRLHRDFATESPKVFPYRNTTAIMFTHFEKLCPTREDYQEWLCHYKLYINRIELLIKAFQHERRVDFPRANIYQKYQTLLGNEATKLIWLRRCGKAWRWDTIEKLKGVKAA